METKKSINQNCEFWLEFENQTRMHINMLDKAEPTKDLIPLHEPEEDLQGSLVVEPTQLEEEPPVE